MGYKKEARENHVKEDVEALRRKMKQKAHQECKDLVSKYAECAYRSTLLVVWQCRKQTKEFKECFDQFSNDDVLEEMKREDLRQQDRKAPAKV